jgi:subtilisin family serine protease
LTIRRSAASTLAVAVSAAFLLTAPRAAGAEVHSGAPVADAATPAARTVTLVTGDRVTLTGDGDATVAYDPARAGIRFITYRQDGHTHVIPSDAAALLGTGQIDSRLFDVTGLLDAGYDDRRADLPLIVGHDTATATARGSVSAAGATVERELPAADALAARLDKRRARGFWHDVAGGFARARARDNGITRVWLDGLRTPVLDVSVPQVGAPAAWQAGFDGTGVTVAVLDTGIDTTHPDLAGKVAASIDFTADADARDFYGHGTHVASTIAGSGAASGGRYRGVAPGATLLNGKVCTAKGCPESAILAGMQWAATHGADVVNMSLGGGDSPEVDPLEQAVTDLTAGYGVLFVIAAGNQGGDFSVSSPASADAALAVGAVDKQDNIASFSSKGPRIGDAGLKPDLTAPGVSITAARSATGVLGEAGQPYLTLNGTSMATPHVAGAAAILTERHRDWSPATLKAALIGSAKPNPDLGSFAQGAGRLDVARALGQPVTVDPPSISLGRQLWPHDDDEVLTKTLTYHNHGQRDLLLHLSVTTLGPFGGPAPDGMFSLSTDTITVPAGGSASVTLTADTRIPGPEGFFSGRVTANADGVVVQTAFGVDRTTEGYELTLNPLNREGEATPANFTVLLRNDAPGVVIVAGRPGPVTVWLPKGRYIGSTSIYETGSPDTSVLITPQLVSDRAQTLDLDARTAKPVRVTVPDPTATPTLVEVGAQLDADGGRNAISSVVYDGTLYSAQAGPGGTVEGFTGKVAVTMARPDADGEPRNSPYAYYLAWFLRGQFPTGFERSVARDALATVRADHAAFAAGGTGYKMAFPVPDGGFNSALQVGMPFQLPFQRTEYYNTDGGARWYSSFNEQVTETGATVGELWSGLNDYRAGQRYEQQWNRPVFGPTLGAALSPASGVFRYDDAIYTDLPVFGDGDGHPGHATVTSGRITLYRDGVKVGESAYPTSQVPSFRVPAAAAGYRLEVAATRGGPAELSTSVSAVWTFASSGDTGEDLRRLPLWTVNFVPALNAGNAAPAGRVFTVPLTATAQPDAAVGSLRTLTAQVSFDDGATWQEAKVAGLPGKPRLLVPHPDRAGFVSVRVTAADSAGNTVVQTVIRAYRIAR